MLFENAWREHRPFVVDLAFRMLGNIGDAEDVAQDAFARLLRVDVEEIDDLRGWLVVVVSRRCLDILRSARVRREDRAGSDVELKPAVDVLDPGDRVTLDDSVRMALHVVLEMMSPAERAAFVLHDVFRYSFEEISSIVGRPTDACRKLASRARQRVEASAGPARFTVEPADYHEIAARFIAACAGGDLEALMQILDADVSGEVDMGITGAKPPARFGRDDVAHNLLVHFAGEGVTLVSQAINGWPGVLVFRDGRLWALVMLETRDGLINEIHALRNPERLAAIGEVVDRA